MRWLFGGSSWGSGGSISHCCQLLLLFSIPFHLQDVPGKHTGEINSCAVETSGTDRQRVALVPSWSGHPVAVRRQQLGPCPCPCPCPCLLSQLMQQPELPVRRQQHIPRQFPPTPQLLPPTPQLLPLHLPLMQQPELPIRLRCLQLLAAAARRHYL